MKRLRLTLVAAILFGAQFGISSRQHSQLRTVRPVPMAHRLADDVGPIPPPRVSKT